MIRARHTPSGRLVASLVAGPLLGSAFHRIRFVGEVADEGLPVLMLANHFCWWDGFIQYRLNRALFHRRLYVMMLEEQLLRHPILARCGCFSVRPNSRSLLETLDYCAGLLRSPEHMVLLFPQGAIRSLHLETPGFQSGAARLIERLDRPFDLLLNVNLPDYGAGKKPVLTGYFKMLHGSDLAGGEHLRREWERFYRECKNRQAAAL